MRDLIGNLLVSVCVVRIADCWRQVCSDRSVTIAKTMSVIAIEGRSLANTVLLVVFIQRFVFSVSSWIMLSEWSKVQNGQISSNPEVISSHLTYAGLSGHPSFFQQSLTAQFGLHSFGGCTLGTVHCAQVAGIWQRLEHRH